MGGVEIAGYEPLVNDVKELIHKKQYHVLKIMNTETINLYWKIGEEIYRQQEINGWGKSIVKVLSKELQKEFSGAKRYGWTKRILANFIKAQTYEKYLLNQTNFDLTLPEERRGQAQLTVKDEYTFDFAELSPEYSEHELEMHLINNIRAFLIEMGGDFTFIANQYHLTVGNRDLYIDLLLFHRRLGSLVAIECADWGGGL